jgi:hypothetical protein
MEVYPNGAQNDIEPASLNFALLGVSSADPFDLLDRNF